MKKGLDIFLNQKVLCSLPELTPKKFLQEFVIDPIPECTVNESPKQSKEVSAYGQKELGAYVQHSAVFNFYSKRIWKYL